MKVLVVGGAGYIGCHMSDLLKRNHHDVIVLDDLSSGHAEFVDQTQLVTGNLGDTDILNQLLTTHTFDAVMHFAAFIQVGESVNNPEKYYKNNVIHTMTLLNQMLKHQIKYFIFSSTAAIFGDPHYSPIDEQHPKNPINPYGKSKWMLEQILQDYKTAYDLQSVSLRYFNAAGADHKTRFGECHEPETHLIPLLLQVANSRRESIDIYGNDYATPDGSCIRDYIHVEDIANAHLKALEKLVQGKALSPAYNLGNGKGLSVFEVIKTAEKITGKKINWIQKPRRIGDPPQLIADATRANKELNWQASASDLENIIETAWRWELKHFSR